MRIHPPYAAAYVSHKFALSIPPKQTLAWEVLLFTTMSKMKTTKKYELPTMTEATMCRECDEMLPENYSFCPYCGEDTTNVITYEEMREQRIKLTRIVDECIDMLEELEDMLGHALLWDDGDDSELKLTKAVKEQAIEFLTTPRINKDAWDKFGVKAYSSERYVFNEEKGCYERTTELED